MSASNKITEVKQSGQQIKHRKQRLGKSLMSDRSVVTLKRRGGSPFSREMDAERRAGRRQHGPSDPEATPSDDEDQTFVEGGRIRDAAAGEVHDDDSHRRSRDLHSPHSPPVTQRQRSTVGTAAAVQVRPVLMKPDRGREANKSTSGATTWGLAVSGVVDVRHSNDNRRRVDNSASLTHQHGASAVSNVPDFRSSTKRQQFGCSESDEFDEADPYDVLSESESELHHRVGYYEDDQFADAEPGERHDVRATIAGHISDRVARNIRRREHRSRRSASTCWSDSSESTRDGYYEERRTCVIEARQSSSSESQHYSHNDDVNEAYDVPVRFDNSHPGDPVTSSDQSWCDDVIRRLDALEATKTSELLRMIEIVAEIERLRNENQQLRSLSSAESAATDRRDPSVRRPMGRCYRCGLRGHHRRDCTNPRQPRRRRRPLLRATENDVSEDERCSVLCNRVTVMGDAVGLTIIGGPADDSTTTGALRSNDTRIGATNSTTQDLLPAALRVHHRGSRSTQKVNEAVDGLNRHPVTIERTTCSLLQTSTVGDAAKSGGTRTDERKIETTDQQRTVRDEQACGRTTSNEPTFTRRSNNRRAANTDVRQHSLKPTFFATRREVDGRTMRRHTTTNDAAAPPLVGGPADGDVGCCGRGGQPRWRC